MVKQNISQILNKAKEEGEIFLVSLTNEELRRTGFGPIWGSEEEFFSSFQYVDVYLIYDGEQYKIKYILDGDPRYTYYESQEDLGKYFVEIVEEYLNF